MEGGRVNLKGVGIWKKNEFGRWGKSAFGLSLQQIDQPVYVQNSWGLNGNGLFVDLHFYLL